MKFNFKKTVSILLAAMMLLTVAVIGVSAEGETTASPKIEQNKAWGDTNNDGVFEIASAEDFLAFAAKRPTLGSYAGKTVKLVADIDLNPGWDASSKTAPTNVWTTMFRFDGIFDGQGHTISGLYSTGDANGNNASFITNVVGATVKNVRIVNSLFIGTNNNAGLIACAKNDSLIENVYVDAIVEAGGGAAGGILAWHFSSSNTETPKSTLKNCVFVGSVHAKKIAGGIVGTTDSYTYVPASGALTFDKFYETTLIDCANYGTVTVDAEDGMYAGGLIGAISGKATVTRCFNAGAVTGAGTKASLLNVTQTTAAPIVIEDAYSTKVEGLESFNKSAAATQVTLKYEGAAADVAATATIAELLEKTAFKTEDRWTLSSEKALPAGLADMVKTHTYEAIVTPPTCTAKGYTTYKCKDAGCDASYVADYTDMVAHTEGEEWIVDKEPTTEAAGSRHKECTVCGKSIKTEVLKKLVAETEAPTEEVTTPVAPATEAPANQGTEQEGGCGSSISGALGILAMLSLGAAVIRKKH